MELREIVLEGHVIDSWVLPKVLDLIMDLEGDFEFIDFRVGKRKTEKSFVRMLIKGRDRQHVERLLSELRELGAISVEAEEVDTEPAPADGVLPAGFYSTTNHPTYVSIGGRWLEVEDIEMDCAIVVEDDRARCKPMGDVLRGEQVVVGVNAYQVAEGQRAVSLERLVVDPAIEARQRARLAALRARRDGERAAAILSRIEAAARAPAEPLMDLFVAAVEADCTLGEICSVLRGVWGEYQPHASV